MFWIDLEKCKCFCLNVIAVHDHIMEIPASLLVPVTADQEIRVAVTAGVESHT